MSDTQAGTSVLCYEYMSKRDVRCGRRTINQYVFSLACGVKEYYGGGWMKRPGEVITCCNDGLRPVYFKLEATDEEAGPFLGRDQ